jgi:hypothetical protein
VCNSVTSNLHCSWYVCAPGSDFHQRLVVATANADGRFNAWNDAFIKLNICCRLLLAVVRKLHENRLQNRQILYMQEMYSCWTPPCTLFYCKNTKKNTAPIRVDMHVYTNTWTLFKHQQKVQKMQKIQEQMSANVTFKRQWRYYETYTYRHMVRFRIVFQLIYWIKSVYCSMPCKSSFFPIENLRRSGNWSDLSPFSNFLRHFMIFFSYF